MQQQQRQHMLINFIHRFSFLFSTLFLSSLTANKLNGIKSKKRTLHSVQAVKQTHEAISIQLAVEIGLHCFQAY